MKIGLVVTGLQWIDARRATSDHASTRLRALLPAGALGRRGHGLLICSDFDFHRGAVDAHVPDLDVLIVHKVRLDLADRLDRARAAGVAVIVDLCDLVFDHPVLSNIYPAMLTRAHLVTAATDVMAEVAAEHVRLPVRVIADAVEGLRREPIRADRSAPLRFLWFGRLQNAGPVVEMLPQLAAFPGAAIEIITDATRPFARHVEAATPAGLAFTLTPWSPEAVEAGLERCDLVLLPADPSPSHRVKSANRMERALWGGRQVAAMRTRAGETWADLAFVEGDMVSAIRRALENRSLWPDRILAAQKRLVGIRSAPALAGEWEAAAEAARRAAGQSDLPASPLGGPTPPV